MVVVRDPHIEKSNSVSPPALLADASYFLAPQEVTKKRCRATPPVLRLLAQPPARCPAFLATNGQFRTRFIRCALYAQTCGTGMPRPWLRYSAAKRLLNLNLSLKLNLNLNLIPSLNLENN